MVSNVFGFETIPVCCTHCGFPHLDRDWFSVHPHRRHQCHGCGKQFSDSVTGIGNPLTAIRQMLGVRPSKTVKAPRSISIKQSDYPGGIQIWGSNPAIIWTSGEPEETGIHLHAFSFDDQAMPGVDDTYAKVSIDGIKLEAKQVRTYMAQSAMPHLEGRIVSLACPSCGEPHFDTEEVAFTPHINHECHSCGSRFQAPTQIKKTISNPFLEVRRKLAMQAPNPLREDKLGLRPETI